MALITLIALIRFATMSWTTVAGMQVDNEHAGLPSRQKELFCKDKNASGHAPLFIANLTAAVV